MKDDLQLDPPDHVFIGIARLGALAGAVVVIWLVLTTITGAPR